MDIKDIEHVVHLSSDVGKKCEHCDKWLAGSNDFADCVNHYLQEHNYRLLHVGSEAGSDMEGKTVSFTVAVVGR